MRTALTNALSASMLAMAVAAVGLILSRRPAILHCLWLIVLVKLLAPPMLEVPLMNPDTAEPLLEAEAASLMIAFDPADQASEAYPPLIFAAEPFETDEPIEIVPDEPAASAPWVEPATLWGLLGVAWLVGSLTTSTLAVVRVRRFQRLLRSAEPAEPEVEDEVAALAYRMGIHRPPAVVFIDGRLTPLLWAVGRPRLVIPRELWKGLDARRRTLLLTHELAHLKRGDHWLRLFELAVTIAYWWLPVVWWVRRALRDVEEQCCDAWVVWMFPDEARTYAETLLDTVDFLNPVAQSEPLLASGFGKVHHLRRRLTMVMLGTTPRTLGWSGTLGALALAGVLLPMSPTWAQKADAPPEANDAKPTTSDDFFITVSADEAAEGALIGKLDANRNGQDDRKDALVLSEYLGDLFLAESDDDKKSDDAKPGEAKKTEEIRVIVRGSDSPKQRAEAIQKTIERLTVRIKEIESKQPDNEATERQIKALKSAVERLQKVAKVPVQAKAHAVSVDVKPIERVIVARRPDIVTGRREIITDNVKGGTVTIREDGGDGKPSEVTIVSDDGTVKADSFDIEFKAKGDPKQTEEARKQIEEARKHVAELSKEVAAKQKQLGEAHRKLAELQGFGRPSAITFRADPRLQGKPLGRINLSRPDRPEQKDDARLDSLEQKLTKVLDELQSLKKQKAEREEHGERR
ncbi:Regulatory protein BlaR1 [Paludisphaera borealis]|uniref:Regulatory protein BlaR1 n=2 Tax=Paludisphaera borealis TaxID=1387353 RepID=A0A1U7CX87_9BACT|nr:Regulatory protein BlaR1 [Paludisphaera borealis]